MPVILGLGVCSSAAEFDLQGFQGSRTWELLQKTPLGVAEVGDGLSAVCSSLNHRACMKLGLGGPVTSSLWDLPSPLLKMVDTIEVTVLAKMN